MTPTLAEVLARPADGPMFPPVGATISYQERRELDLPLDLEVTLVQGNAARGQRLYRAFVGPRYVGAVSRPDQPVRRAEPQK